jgi:hypothetical protein
MAFTEYRFVIRLVSRLLDMSCDEPEGEARAVGMVIVDIEPGCRASGDEP